MEILITFLQRPGPEQMREFQKELAGEAALSGRADSLLLTLVENEKVPVSLYRFSHQNPKRRGKISRFNACALSLLCFRSGSRTN